MSKLLIVAALAMVAGAHAGTVAIGQNGFCQRYAAALFGNANAVNETSLISAVVARALNGATTGVNGALNNVVGILNSGLQQGFFTTILANPTDTNNLILHLNQFFQIAFNCRDIPASGYAVNQRVAHQNLAINVTVWNDFVGQLVNTLTSFGVPSTDAPAGTGEITYAAALLGQFLRGANQICNQANCAAASAFFEFSAGTVDGTQRWLLADTNVQTVTIPMGSNVHWNFGNAHGVVEATSAFVAKPSPLFTSGAVTAGRNTYTFNFATAGTYYFVCPAHASMTGTIIVTNPNAMSSTGGSSAASGLQASLAVAVVAIAAVFALRH